MIFNPVDTYKANVGSLVRRAKFYRDKALLLPRGPAQLDNIYCATVQKCGSQWINAVFSDERIRQITKLVVYPQHHYDINDFRLSFPRGAFVPGLYFDYTLYDIFIKKPEKYKTIYIFRDPRDIAVSWYWSARSSHPRNHAVDINRRRLQAMSEDDGLSYVINYLAPKFAAIRTWVELGGLDKNVRLISFEKLMRSPEEELCELMLFCGFSAEKSLIKEVVKDYTKEKMRERDIRNKKGEDEQESHYRRKSSSHKEMFKQQHYQLFDGVAGDLVERLGYK